MKRIKALYLTVRPSFLEGIARLFDFQGTLRRYNTATWNPSFDTRALQKDWFAVGKDLKNAIDSYGGRKTTR